MQKEFIRLAIPNILSNLTVPLVGLVDVALMGRLPSYEFLIAIGLATVIFNFVYWAFGFLRMGTTGLVAQSYGANDKKKQQELLLRALGLGVGIGFLLVLFQWPIVKSSLFLFQNSISIENSIADYFYVRIYAAPATIGLYAITGWLLGMQDAKMTLVLAIIINLTNAILSWILVSYFNLSITGVALGTVFAQYLGFIIGIIIIKIKYPAINFKFKTLINNSKSEWFEFFKVNSDLFFRTLALIFTLSFFKIKATEIGELIGAANVILLEFITISAYGIDGLAFAAESLTGKYYGTKNKGLLKKSISISLKYGLIFGLIISIIFYFFGEVILGLLTDKKSVIDIALIYLPWLVIAPVINALSFIWDGIYIGATATKGMKLSIVYSMLLIFFPAYFLFSNLWGNHGIWLALTCFMLARGIFQTVWAKRYII